MPRDIPLGNGTLLVTFDRKYQLRDFYFPHPGRENQTSGEPFRIGVWADGTFSWVSSDDWVRELRYQSETLVSEVKLHCERLAIEILSTDAVDFYENVLVRRMVVTNLTDMPREVRVFFHHDFRISETEISDTAYFDPSTSSVIHYKRNRYFLTACRSEHKHSFDQWATGRKGFGGAEGTWRDAEDGLLGGNAIAQGSVDSTIGITLDLDPHGKEAISYWLAAGKSYADVQTINQVVRDKEPESLIQRTAVYWRAWVNKEGLSFDGLPSHIADAFKRSLLIIRTNLDDNGAVLAANDGDVEDYNGDTYSYMWPRDGALTSYALDISGFSELARRFYLFAKDLVTNGGYFLHKYTPDGQPGSSWHPWINQGTVQLPIQEDETALILWGLWKHYHEHRDFEFVTEFYRPVITKAANFMVEYRHADTGLPLPSYDLWEERRGIHTFTASAVWAGLQAAARFAELFGEQDLVARYEKAAEEIKSGVLRYLFRPELGRFARTMTFTSSGSAEYDPTIDASLYGIWYFGLLPPDDPMVRSTMEAVRQRLWSKTEVGGLARYENDCYHQVTGDVANVPGNPWFICTLWLAEYQIALADSEQALEQARGLIEWVIGHALDSGVLAEQVHPYSDEPLSVSPLTWSHAQLVTTVMEYLFKLRQLKLCGACGQPIFDLRSPRHRAVTSRLVPST